jgi:DNA-binding transcriptional ArsR family regulator
MIDEALVPLAAARFKALGDPVRLSLLAALQDGEKTVGDLVHAIRRKQPNVSQQLASLQRAGLVASRRDGNRVFYRSVDPLVGRVCDAVCMSLTAGLGREARRMKELQRAGSRRATRG